MNFKVSTESGKVPVTVVHVDGDIDSASIDVFQAKMEELIAGGARYMLLDLSPALFISSAGLRAFNNLFTKLRDLHPDANLSDEETKKGIREGTFKSPHLKLLHLSEGASKLFKLSGYDMYIDTFEDQKTAIASF